MASHSLNYDPVPSVNPTGAPGNDFLRINATPEAFGAGIGRAKEQLGHAEEHASQEGFGVAELQAQMDSRTHAAEVHSWQSDQTTDATEKFLSLRGKAALEALPDYKKQIDDLHKQARDQAGNPYTAQLIDAQGRSLIDRSYSGAARHAAQQRAAWESTTADDAAKSYGNQASLAATQSQTPALDSDENVQRYLGNSDMERRNHAEMQGYDGPAIEQEVAKNRGGNVKNIVEQIAGDGSPTGLKRAFDFYKSQETKIDAGSRLQIQNFLKGPLNTIAGEKIADETMGRPPERTPPEIVADIPANFFGAIKQTEGYSSRAKWDYKQNTNGFGTKAQSPNEVIDVATANRRFNAAIGKSASFVDSVNPNLDAGTRAALTSLTYNAGEGWADSGLGQKIKSGDLNGAKELFLQYNKAGGETNEGLVARRAREASWFGRGDLTQAESIAPVMSKGAAMLRIMDDPDLINRPQVQAAALAHVNKIYSAYSQQAATDSATFKLKLANSTAEGLNTGRVTQPISEGEFIGALGAEEGPRAFADYQSNVQLGADIHATAGLDPPQLQALQQKYEPQPGENYIAQSKRSEALDKAIKSNLDAQKKDPADYLIRRTEAGGDAYSQFQTLVNDPKATPQMRAAYADMYANKMLEEQRRLGIPDAEARIVPKWYVDNIQKQLTNPDAAGGAPQVAATLQREAQLWGNHWPDIYRQIAKDSEPIVRVVGSGIQPWAASKLINSMSTKESELLKNDETPTEKLTEITKAVDTELAPFFKSLSGSQRDVTVSDFRTMATKLATIYVTHPSLGGDFGQGDKDKAAKKAVNDLVGFKYDFKDTYRIPKDQNVSPDVIQAGVAEATRLLGSPAPFDHPEAPSSLTPAAKVDQAFPGRKDLADDTAERARLNGLWLTDPKERGLVLFQGDGTAVRRADGQPLMLSWQQLSQLSQTRKQRTSDFAAPGYQ